MKELKQCPFCGDNAHCSHDGYEETNYVRVGCNSCQCGTAYCETLEQVVKIWNTRVGTATEQDSEGI